MLLTHYASESSCAEPRTKPGHDPDRLSFTRSLRVIRRQVTNQADFSPERRTQHWQPLSPENARQTKRTPTPRPTHASSTSPPQTPTESNAPATPEPHTTGHQPSTYTDSPKPKLSGIAPDARGHWPSGGRWMSPSGCRVPSRAAGGQPAPGRQGDSTRLAGVYSARATRDWRVLYLVDDEQRRVSCGRSATAATLTRVTVACFERLAVRHRSDLPVGARPRR